MKTVFITGVGKGLGLEFFKQFCDKNYFVYGLLTNCLWNDLGEKIEFVSITPGKLITELAQKDANLSPGEGAARIMESWEKGKLKSANGILQVPDNTTLW